MKSLLNTVNTKLDSTGTIAHAHTLATSRKINGTNFNGSEDITTSSWGEEREITIVDADGSNSGVTKKIDGSENYILELPSTIKATLVGNATTATTAGTAMSISWSNIANKPSPTVSVSTAANADASATVDENWNFSFNIPTLPDVIDLGGLD
jgi:hypothetical protein